MGQEEAMHPCLLCEQPIRQWFEFCLKCAAGIRTRSPATITKDTASVGPVPTAQTTVCSVPIADKSVSGAKTELVDRSRERLRDKHRVGQKSHKANDVVHRAQVHDLLREKGEEDAQEELAEQKREEEKETEEVVIIPEKETRLSFAVPDLDDKHFVDRMRRELPQCDLVVGGTLDPCWMKELYEKYCASIHCPKGKRCVTIGRPKVADCHHRHHIHNTSDVGVDAECSCRPGHFCELCAGADVYILIDSIQHFTPQQIAFLMGDGERVYSVQYEYRAKRGGHHVLPGGLPEVRWERDAEGLWVEDGQHMSRYRKNPADWTRPGSIKLEGGDTLAWRIATRAGDCLVVQFYLVIAEQAEVQDKDAMNDSYYGDVTPDMIGLADARATELWPIMSTINHIYSADDMFYCLTQDSEVLVPKQGVGHIALWAAGKKREEKTYADACIQARQWLKTTRLTTMERADSIPYIVSFGLLRNLEAENRAMNVLSFHSAAVAVHNARVADPFAPTMTEWGRRMVVWASANRWWLAPATAAMTTVAVFTLSLFTKGKIQGALQNWIILMSKYNAYKIEISRQRKVASANLLDKIVEFATHVSTSLCQPAVVHPKASAATLMFGVIAFLTIIKALRKRPQPRVAGPLITYCAKGRELKPMREGAECTISDMPDGSCDLSHVDCHVTEGPFHIGLGISNHIPVLARHCIHNDVVAVRNRGICERKQPEIGWWATTGRRRMFTLFGNLGPVIPTDRQVWLERFPGKQQRDLEKAEQEDLLTDPYSSGRRKAFTKSECAEKRTDPTEEEPWGAIEGYDPRLIQGCQMEYVNATGPFAHALSKTCKGEHGDTTYGPGLNSQALDMWLADAESSFDEETAYVDSDAVRLDASVCVDCIKVTTSLYRKLGAPEEALAMFNADIVTHGYTSQGVKYSTPGTVPSGKTTTTVGNTIAVITVVEEALKGIKHKAIVAGDDAAILVPARLAKETKERLTLVGARAGFEFKVKASRYRYDMEFCSGRWWPAATRDGFGFGPKPGKLLPKLFFADTRNACGRNTGAYLHAVSTGMLPNVSHLPVVREFVEQVHALSETGPKYMKASVKEKLERTFRVQRQLPVQQSPEIWEAYAHIYGISQQECMDAVSKIREVEIMPNLLRHHVYDAMVEQDAPAVGDPVDRDPSLLAGASLARLLGLGTSLSPLLEEWFRRRWPRATTTALVLTEACLWKASGNSLLTYLPAAGLHIGACALTMSGHPYAALLAHLSFNWWVGRRPATTYENCAFRSLGSRPLSCNLAAKLVDSYSSLNMSYSALPQRPPRARRPKKRQGGKPRPPRVPVRGRAVQQYKAKRAARRRPRRTRLSRGRGAQRMNPMRNSFPSGNNSRPKRTCFVENDEYIGEILGANSSTVPVIAVFPVNPGQSSTFPWLSEQALQWEKYHFDYLEFYYKPEVSGFATEGQSGKVILMADYDASDPAPTTKQEMEDTDPHVDGMPYEDIMLTLDPYEMFLNSDAKYVRPFGLPGGSDIKTYDAANLNVMTLNNGGTAAVGELHVRYGVTFEVPVLEATKSNAPANNQVALLLSTAPEAAVSTVPLNLALATTQTNGIGLVDTAGSIVLPAGNYLIDAYAVCEDTSAEAFKAVLALFNLTTTSGIGVAAQFNNSGATGGGATQVVTPSLSQYVSLNGTTAISLRATLTGAAGTLTANGSLRVTAV